MAKTVDVEEIVFETENSSILTDGTLSSVIKKIGKELEEAGQIGEKPTPMKIVIHIGA